MKKLLILLLLISPLMHGSQASQSATPRVIVTSASSSSGDIDVFGSIASPDAGTHGVRRTLSAVSRGSEREDRFKKLSLNDSVSSGTESASNASKIEKVIATMSDPRATLSVDCSMSVPLGASISQASGSSVFQSTPQCAFSNKTMENLNEHEQLQAAVAMLATLEAARVARHSDTFTHLRSVACISPLFTKLIEAPKGNGVEANLIKEIGQFCPDFVAPVRIVYIRRLNI